MYELPMHQMLLLIVKVLSNKDSTACEGYTRPFPFPQLGIQPPIEGYMLCRKPGCSLCAKSPEAFTVHNECLQLFQQRCKSFSHLWTRAAWRKPWRGASAIAFHSTEFPILCQSFMEVAARLRMPTWISKLPLEILAIVRRFSSNALIWKYAAVLGLADHICTDNRLGNSRQEPFNHIYHWERGAQVCLKDDGSMLPIIRLGIDSRGIKTLERFATDEPLNNSKGGCSAFVIEREESLHNVTAEFKVCLIHLIKCCTYIRRMVFYVLFCPIVVAGFECGILPALQQ
jgi:hypothetical protein